MTLVVGQPVPIPLGMQKGQPGKAAEQKDLIDKLILLSYLLK
jgi:hypothetical protein